MYTAICLGKFVNDKRIYVDAGVSGFGQTLDKTKILRTQTEQNWTL